MDKASRRVDILSHVKHGNLRVGAGPSPQNGNIFQSDYFAMLRPVLWMGFIFGRIPCYLRSGWLRFTYKSLPFAYAVVYVVANWTVHIFNNGKISGAMRQIVMSSVSFNNVLFSFLIFTQPLTTLVTIYSWVFEMPAIVECFNTTAMLEKRVTDFFPSQKRPKSTTRLVMLSIALFFVADLITAYFLIVGRYGDQFPLLVLLLLIVNFTVNYSLSILWCLSFYFISDFAAKLNKNILLVQGNRSFRPKTFRKIWLSIWKQSQNYANSIGVSIGFTLFLNGTIFVVGCYGACASVRDGNFLGLVEMFPYIIITLGIIVSLFEMPYQATNSLGSVFLDTLVVLNREATDQRVVDEIQEFVNTINLTQNAAITLKDYVTMDRTLLVSFLSCALTYLIVLLQFQSKDTGRSCTVKNYTVLN